MESQGPRDGICAATVRAPEGASDREVDRSPPVGYLTTEGLAALWAERRREADRHRRAHPDDLRGVELRQRAASQLLQTLRLLADLERQLDIVLGLPVLGVGRSAGRAPAEDG